MVSILELANSRTVGEPEVGRFSLGILPCAIPETCKTVPVSAKFALLHNGSVIALRDRKRSFKLLRSKLHGRKELNCPQQM